MDCGPVTELGQSLGVVVGFAVARYWIPGIRAALGGSLPGSRLYNLSNPADEPSILMLQEEWESEELLKLHVKSEGFQTVLTHFRSNAQEAGPQNAIQVPSDRLTDLLSLNIKKTDQSHPRLEDYCRSVWGTAELVFRDGQ
jgi:hypothetical protein